LRTVNFKPRTTSTYTYWDINDESIRLRYMDDQCKPLFIKSGGSLVRLYVESEGHSYKL